MTACSVDFETRPPTSPHLLLFHFTHFLCCILHIGLCTGVSVGVNLAAADALIYKRKPVGLVVFGWR